MESGAYIVCFIASVIKEPRRLAFFKLLLDSIRGQTHLLDGLFISIYIDPSLNVDWSNMFKGLGNTHILRQKNQKQQFVQIGEMSKKLESKFTCPQNKTLFIMFSDDDDLWHCDRVKQYAKSWNDAPTYASPEKIASVASICMSESMTIDISCNVHMNSSNVDEMIECGCVNVTIPTQEDAVNTMVEYHEYVVKHKVLIEFLKEYDWIVRNNRFADMEFRTFVARYNLERGSTIFIRPDTWGYFYRKCDPTYVNVTNPTFSLKYGGFSARQDSKRAEIILRYVAEGQECKSMANIMTSHFEATCVAMSKDDKDREFITRLYLRIKMERNELR